MPRRSILSATELDSLLTLPTAKDDLIRYYEFSESDLSVIRQRRGPVNRLGFAVQLCYLRSPGVILGADEAPFPPVLEFVAEQLKVPAECWAQYGERDQIRNGTEFFRTHLSSAFPPWKRGALLKLRLVIVLPANRFLTNPDHFLVNKQ